MEKDWKNERDENMIDKMKIGRGGRKRERETKKEEITEATIF